MSTVTIIIKFSESVQLFAGIIHAFRNMRYCFEHVFAGQTVVKILNNMFGTFFLSNTLISENKHCIQCTLHCRKLETVCILQKIAFLYKPKTIAQSLCSFKHVVLRRFRCIDRMLLKNTPNYCTSSTLDRLEYTAVLKYHYAYATP